MVTYTYRLVADVSILADLNMFDKIEQIKFRIRKVFVNILDVPSIKLVGEIVMNDDNMLVGNVHISRCRYSVVLQLEKIINNTVREMLSDEDVSIYLEPEKIEE